MKKIIAVLLALMLCMSVALAETAAVTGVWYLNEIGDAEMKVNPASLGMEMVMTLNEDNTAAMDAMGEVTEGSWVADGEGIAITFDGDPQTFNLVEGNLVAEQEGTILTFGREKAEVEVFTLGAVKADATMADYNGTWNATLVDMMGMQLPVADMGLSMQITVADGKATLVEGMGEEAGVAEGVATVEDGALIILADGDTEKVPFQLYEGDVLVQFTDLGEGMTMSLYFEKVVE